MALGFRTSAVIDCRTGKVESVEYLADTFGLIYHKRGNLWTWFDQPNSADRKQGKRRHYIEKDAKTAVHMCRLAEVKAR